MKANLKGRETIYNAHVFGMLSFLFFLANLVAFGPAATVSLPTIMKRSWQRKFFHIATNFSSIVGTNFSL